MMTTDPEFTERLPEEVAGWRRDDLISVAQARSIMARYGLDWAETDESRRRGRLSNVVMTLGAVLTGIGVIVFVASNWKHIGRIARIVLLLVALAAVYGSALWANHLGHPVLGASLVFLGTLIFGANVFVVAQTYHVNSGSPHLLGFWAAGALASAYTAGSRPSVYLGVFCLILWYMFQLAEWDMFSRGSDAAALSAAAFIPLGLFGFNLGGIHRAYSGPHRLAGAWINLGVITVFSGLLVFSFAEVWRSLGSSTNTNAAASYQAVIFYAAFSIGALTSLAFIVARAASQRQAIFHGLGITLIWLSSLLVVFHPFDSPGAYALVFNLVLLAAIVWAVSLGIWTRQEPLINLALIFFALQVLARYFDFFFALFDRSLVFIGAGILLLGGGWLIERSRRLLIARMQTETDPADA
jgi:uncharacterized membrane protein